MGASGCMGDFFVLEFDIGWMKCKIKMWGWGTHISVHLQACDFLSLYSQFYEVIILKNTYVIDKEKMQSEYLNIKSTFVVEIN
jgi:hypothetical protein